MPPAAALYRNWSWLVIVLVRLAIASDVIVPLPTTPPKPPLPISMPMFSISSRERNVSLADLITVFWNRSLIADLEPPPLPLTAFLAANSLILIIMSELRFAISATTLS